MSFQIINFKIHSLNDTHSHILGTHVVRDCLSSIRGSRREECLANGDFCKACDKRVCNKKTNFPKCYTGEWSSKICTNYNDVCFTHFIGEHVIKGCFQEYVQENKLSTTFKEENAKNPSFTTCSTPMCNNEQSDLVVDIDYGNENEDNNQSDFDVSSEDENLFIDEEEDKTDEYSDYEDNNKKKEQITRKKVIEFNCFMCDSKDDIECKSNVIAKMSVLCPPASEALGCYHIITGES